MFLRLLLLFTLVPILELALLIEIGQYLGTVPTLVLVLGTGAFGASLARREGTQALYRLRQNLAQGRFPGEEIFDGVLILAGALLLVTPGIVTDVLGFAALLPLSRNRLKTYLKAAISRRLSLNTFETSYKSH